MGNSCNCVLLVCLYYFKMPPTEQQTLPIGESTLKSIGDLKTLNKAIKFPVVSDTVKKATDVVTQISENAHVETARQYLQDGIKTLSETEAFTNIQGKVKELNENPRVQEVITNINLKEKVDRLDTFAADGIENLASAVPSLRAPTPQLVETAKDTANSYLYLATEYLASFSVAQISLRVAEGTTDMLKADSDDGLMASTSTKIKQVRRAIRAVKRAGERKSILEKDPVARTGIVGSIVSLLHVNTILSYLGLRLEAKEEDSEDSEVIEPMEVDEAEDVETPMEHDEVNEVEATEDKPAIEEPAIEEPAVEVSKTEEEAVAEEVADDGDDNHRHIADLKGDLEGYKSEEDPDYDPARDEDVEAEDELADSRELSEDENEMLKDEKEDTEVVMEETKTTAVSDEIKDKEVIEEELENKEVTEDDKVVTVDETKEKDASLDEIKEKDVSLDEIKEKDVSLDEIKDKDVSLEEYNVSLDESKDKDISLEEIKDKVVSEDEKEKVSEDEKDDDVSEDEAIIEEAVEIEEDVIVEEDKLVEVTEDIEDIEDSDEEELQRSRPGVNPLL